ncbi:uncharacterized protein PpBr36_11062 [Pyricularia pennisetigena]|uniref:uncharacterized protein n=1 Tax=Pyricularia pennisetigena TaxID=1578925 RepID=UPI001154BFE1|nr:uncharacterized protein PpBr36_11062 [Pyricularia pennisetigena]TLS20637.1 hypothetical protein PpBr36_11062 [Pyricularia pennisetigena]
MRVNTVSKVVRLCESILTRQHQSRGFVRYRSGYWTSIIYWVEKFVRTTTAEQHGLGGSAWEEIVQDDLAYFRAILSFPDIQGSSFMHFLRLRSSGGVTDRYKMLAANYCFKRSFILTSTGRLGIGPETTDPGDVVSVILGGGVPYIFKE